LSDGEKIECGESEFVHEEEKEKLSEENVIEEIK